jgi:hypothetical protein
VQGQHSPPFQQFRSASTNTGADADAWTALHGYILIHGEHDLSDTFHTRPGKHTWHSRYNVVLLGPVEITLSKKSTAPEIRELCTFGSSALSLSLTFSPRSE